MLLIMFEYLSSTEDLFFTNFYENNRKSRIKSDGTYDTEIKKIDTLSFKIEDFIELGKDTSNLWKFRYYEHYFHETNNQPEHIKSICQHYLDGMNWIANYYFVGCISWTWSYPFSHAPFISDLSV